MRHFRSILYALVLAPAVWVLAGVGFTHDLTARGLDDFAVESVAGLLMLVLAGAAYAILLFAPISPAGPLVGGLAYLGISAWALAAPEAYAGVWPESVAKEGFDISRPGFGLAALLALPLICTALSARRWAGYEPPVLPFVGQLGRARGHVAMPPTAATPRLTDADQTMAMRLTGPGANDTTAVVVNGRPSPDPDATTVLPSKEATASGTGMSAAPEPMVFGSNSIAPLPPDEKTAESVPAGLAAPDDETVENASVGTASTDDKTAESTSSGTASPDGKTAEGTSAGTASPDEKTAESAFAGAGSPDDTVHFDAGDEKTVMFAAIDEKAVTTAPSEEETVQNAAAIPNPAEIPDLSDSYGESSSPLPAVEVPSEAVADAAGEQGTPTPVVVVVVDSGTADDRGTAASTEASVEDTATADRSGNAVVDAVVALAAEEPFKIGEVVDVAPEDEATIALSTVRAERQTAVVVSWDEAATVAALFNGQASTRRAFVVGPPVELKVVELEAADAGTTHAEESPAKTSDDVSAAGDKSGGEVAAVVVVKAEDSSAERPAETNDRSQPTAEQAGAAEQAEAAAQAGATENGETAEAATSATADSSGGDSDAEAAPTVTVRDDVSFTEGDAQVVGSGVDARSDQLVDETRAADEDGEARSGDIARADDNDTEARTGEGALEAQSDQDDTGGPTGDVKARSGDDAADEPVLSEPTAAHDDTADADRPAGNDDAGVQADNGADDGPAGDDAQVRADDSAVDGLVRGEATAAGGGADGAADGGVSDEFADLFVVGRAKPAPNTRGVPPELEETRSLEAPDPDRTRAINLGELTTKLQITPAEGEGAEAVNEPVRARATVAAPDTTGPDLSGVEVTRSLTAPDPDRTRTIKVFTADDTAESSAATQVAFDDGETTRSLTAPDPDRTQRIVVFSSDDVTMASGLVAVGEDGETTRSLSAPDPDRTQAITVPGVATRDLDVADPERTHGVKVSELAAPLHLLPPEPAVDLAAHPGRASGQNTAALSHTGDIGGDETQVIRLDPERTQVIRPGTVEPPGERTEIVRLSAKGKATVRGRTDGPAAAAHRDGAVVSVADEPEIPAQREPS